MQMVSYLGKNGDPSELRLRGLWLVSLTNYPFWKNCTLVSEIDCVGREGQAAIAMGCEEQVISGMDGK